MDTLPKSLDSKSISLAISDFEVEICSFSCSLLREGMTQIIINSEAPGFKALEKAGNESAISEVSMQ